MHVSLIDLTIETIKQLLWLFVFDGINYIRAIHADMYENLSKYRCTFKFGAP